jgi:OmcA/MtrC family decaheme c-type cytochrome
MTAFFRALVILATASAVSFPTQLPEKFNQVVPTANSSARRRAVGTPSTPIASRPTFTKADVEYYLTDDGIAYIRPGMKIKINSITVPAADRKMVVDLNLTDMFDQPLDRLGKTTPGTTSISFLIAWWNADTRLYTSYINRTVASQYDSKITAVQATGENNGTWTDLGSGHYTYKFNNALPASYDATKTHTLGIYGSRTLTEANNFIDKVYYVNVEYDFRPDGQKVVDTWDKIRDAASCHNCHDAQTTFGFHGGSRREVKLCVLCHNPGTTDPETGNSVDMAVLTHKIHAGEHLANGYTIVGNRGSIHDYSEVVYPQDLRNCDNCHEGTVASNKPTQSHVWYSYPSRRACGACHDKIDWATGVGHEGGAATDDATCATCHTPDSGHEFDASVKAAHVIWEKSSQLPGIVAQIVSVSNVAPGQKPVIKFKLTTKAGVAIDGSKLSTFSPMHAGPTTSYTTYFRENGVAGGTNTNPATFDAATGVTTYTFTNPIPADAKGTWAFSADIYKTSTLKRYDGKDDITGVRDAAVNPMKYVSLTGGTPVVRRSSVDMALCNKCHDRLAPHGGQRMVIDECVICHNPVSGDKSVRPAGTGEEESISMQRMIHRIHRGIALTQDFTVYGFRGSVNNYNHVGYPGDLRNCAACHINSSQYVPAAGDAVVTKRDFFSPQGSGTAACLGCHDDRDAAAHAYLNTTQFFGQPAEACGACHGDNADWSVDRVHAR